MSQTIASILQNKGREIWAVHPRFTVFEALSQMAERDVGALLVMAGARLVGVLSERDYARKIALMGRSSHEVLVEEIMTTSPITVSPGHTIDECMRIMTHHRIRHLPVVDEDTVVGVVSIGDLVNAIISEQAETIGHLHTYIASAYPV